MNVDALLDQFRTDLAAANDPAALEDVRRTHTGKKSPIKAAFKELRSLSPDERASTAAALNQASQTWQKLAPLRELNGPEARARVQAFIEHYQDARISFHDADGAHQPVCVIPQLTEACRRKEPVWAGAFQTATCAATTLYILGSLDELPETASRRAQTVNARAAVGRWFPLRAPAPWTRFL